MILLYSNILKKRSCYKTASLENYFVTASFFRQFLTFVYGINIFNSLFILYVLSKKYTKEVIFNDKEDYNEKLYFNK